MSLSAIPPTNVVLNPNSLNQDRVGATLYTVGDVVDFSLSVEGVSALGKGRRPCKGMNTGLGIISVYSLFTGPMAMVSSVMSYNTASKVNDVWGKVYGGLGAVKSGVGILLGSIATSLSVMSLAVRNTASKTVRVAQSVLSTSLTGTLSVFFGLVLIKQMMEAYHLICTWSSISDLSDKDAASVLIGMTGTDAKDAQFKRRVGQKTFELIKSKADAKAIVKSAKDELNSNMKSEVMQVTTSVLSCVGFVVSSVATAGIGPLVAIIIDLVAGACAVGLDTYALVNAFSTSKAGQYDKVIYAIAVLVLTAAVIAASVLSGGVLPVVLTVVTGVVLISMQCYLTYRSTTCGDTAKDGHAQGPDLLVDRGDVGGAGA